MRVAGLGALLMAALVVVCGIGSIASAAPGGPPAGLTAYGNNVWNLDALLRDVFGDHAIYLNERASYPRTPAHYSPTVIDLAQSRVFVYTFANAHGSNFRLVRPAHPPKSRIGASGWDAPLTVKGAYISCGHKHWLYEHGGEAYANWWVGCLA